MCINLEKGLGSGTVGLGSPQISLSPGVLGCRHHLHGLGDLLDVLDGLQTKSDDLQGGHATLLRLEHGRALCHTGKKTNNRVKISSPIGKWELSIKLLTSGQWPRQKYMCVCELSY